MKIKLFTIADMEVRISPLSIFVLLVCVALQMTNTLLITLFALALHELCHILTAKKLCVRINSIDIEPCGFTAIMQTSTIPLKDDIAISMSGVFFSLISGALTHTVMSISGFESDMLMRFSQVSITLGIVNLMPVLPLDGGRILIGLFNIFFSNQISHKISIILGMLISFAVIVFGAYGIYEGILNFTVCIMGILMLLSNFSHMKKHPDEKVSNILRRSNTLSSGYSIPVSIHAVNENVELSNVISQFNANKYNVVHVIDSSMMTTATLDEAEILNASALGCKRLKDIARKP